MRIQMNTDRQAAPDGITIVDLVAGGVYDVREELGQSYLERGFAELAEGEELSRPPENNSGQPPPEDESSGKQLEQVVPEFDLEKAGYGEKLSYYNAQLRGENEPLRWGTRKSTLDAAIAEGLAARQGGE